MKISLKNFIILVAISVQFSLLAASNRSKKRKEAIPIITTSILPQPLLDIVSLYLNKTTEEYIIHPIYSARINQDQLIVSSITILSPTRYQLTFNNNKKEIVTFTHDENSENNSVIIYCKNAPFIFNRTPPVQLLNHHKDYATLETSSEIINWSINTLYYQRIPQCSLQAVPRRKAITLNDKYKILTVQTLMYNVFFIHVNDDKDNLIFYLLTTNSNKIKLHRLFSSSSPSSKAHVHASQGIIAAFDNHSSTLNAWKISRITQFHLKHPPYDTKRCTIQ